jgi:hypothetical protein
MTKFITLTKPVTIPAADLFSKPTIFPVGKRFGILDRDGIAIDGKTIFKTMVIVDGRFVDFNIPTDAVTAKTLENFKIN